MNIFHRGHLFCRFMIKQYNCCTIVVQLTFQNVISHNLLLVLLVEALSLAPQQAPISSFNLSHSYSSSCWGIIQSYIHFISIFNTFSIHFFHSFTIDIIRLSKITFFYRKLSKTPKVTTVFQYFFKWQLTNTNNNEHNQPTHRQ